MKINSVCRQFVLDGEVFSIGDCVLVSRQEKLTGSVEKEDCYIAQLIDLFEKGMK